MQPAHKQRETESVGTIAHLFNDWEWTKCPMGQFLGGPSGLDVTCIEVDHVTQLVVWGRCLFLVVIVCHVILGLH